MLALLLGEMGGLEVRAPATEQSVAADMSDKDRSYEHDPLRDPFMYTAYLRMTPEWVEQDFSDNLQLVSASFYAFLFFN